MAEPTGDQRATQDFLWGAATASYQIEGSYNVDGKGPSIWDTFAHMPGKVERGETGDDACDHYRLWDHDVALMARLGLQAYRLSLAWPRIFPEGRGHMNPAGMDFYDRLIDALLAQHIVPFVTLHHWDLPQALQDQGGWRNRDTACRMQDYADAVTARLGDRVQHWLTLNEPFISTQFGHVEGIHAPGLRDFANYFPVTHHQLLAHGLALEAIRANVKDAQAGIAFSIAEIQPATDRDEDEAAALQADALQNGAYLDTTLRGHYPKLLEPFIPPDLIQSGDLDSISQPTDLIGVNYYLRLLVKAQRNEALPGYTVAPWPPGPRTEMGWEVYPEGLGRWLRRIARDYPDHAIYITENGAAYPDERGPDDTINDPQRIAYLRAHIQTALDAKAAGVPLRGYFAWSLLDNFEWQYGYRPRFGLIGVDFATQERTLKASAQWYAMLIASGGLDKE